MKQQLFESTEWPKAMAETEGGGGGGLYPRNSRTSTDMIC